MAMPFVDETDLARGLGSYEGGTLQCAAARQGRKYDCRNEEIGGHIAAPRAAPTRSVRPVETQSAKELSDALYSTYDTTIHLPGIMRFVASFCTSIFASGCV